MQKQVLTLGRFDTDTRSDLNSDKQHIDWQFFHMFAQYVFIPKNIMKIITFIIMSLKLLRTIESTIATETLFALTLQCTSKLINIDRRHQCPNVDYNRVKLPIFDTDVNVQYILRHVP